MTPASAASAATMATGIAHLGSRRCMARNSSSLIRLVPVAASVRSTVEVAVCTGFGGGNETFPGVVTGADVAPALEVSTAGATALGVADGDGWVDEASGADPVTRGSLEATRNAPTSGALVNTSSTAWVAASSQGDAGLGLA